MDEKLKKALYQPYKWFVFTPVLGLSTAFFGSGAILLSHLMDSEKAGKLMGSTWSRVNARMAPMSVTVEGRENIEEGQSYVICSNHQSHFDIFAIYGYLGVDIRWVMKEELRKVPFLGTACDRIGHIYIDRSNPKKAVASLQEAKDRLKKGASVIFFPEGTRSEDGKLQPFKKGAFRMAMDLKLPILPLTIQGTRHVLPARSMDLMPGKAHIQVHQPIETAGLADGELPDLMERVRQVIASGLTED